jgi:YVTN family beta-propeller protein
MPAKNPLLPPRAARFLLLSVLVAASPLPGQQLEVKNPPGFPGRSDAGFLLPNGWRLTPAGSQVPLADLPLNILVSADSKQAFVATSGYNAHELTVVNLDSREKVAAESVRQSWFGLATDGAGRFWWSGGGDAALHAFQWSEGKLNSLPGLPTAPNGSDPNATPLGFRTGVCYDPNSQNLFSLTILGRSDAKTFPAVDGSIEESRGGVISRIHPGGEPGERKAACGKRPYDVVLARNGLLYVSDWADRRLLAVDPESLRTVARVSVGEHPNQIVLHPADDRLFVACASDNAVYVVDTHRGVVEETIFTALFPQAPEGSTPDALCLSPDGDTLFVANADNNCVAVVDIDERKKSQVKGFIPTGWYPTAVAVTPDGRRLLVGVGKGNETLSNKPDQETLETALAQPEDVGGYRRIPFPHVGKTLSGSLSIVDLADDKALAAFTDQVYRNCPYSDALLSVAPHSRKTAIPNRVGDPSPIRYVIYIIKENRTYDQVLSDIPRGKRDPSLLMFGEEVTPNHHKLANEFVLLDNLYCNGHVSADGHPWSTMAYNTDYIARNWALTYSRREGIDDDDEGNLSNAPSGYIWDSCARHGLTYRSYGEYGSRVSQPDGSFKMEGRVPGLVGHMSPRYGLPTRPDQKVRDTDRVDVFLEEFREYEKNDNLPRFIVMSLGEDHTQGTTPGAPTPQACVASNDLALGRLVEAVSKSKFWPETAIFVIEDDAQNGPDHVDAHRTVGLVISPYVRRKHLDSTQYTTVSMIRTMELILGLPPLSQFDAAANPMFESFTDVPDLTGYTHEPARIDLGAQNQPTAYGAERSSRMDFTEYDRIDDFELNEILWRAVKGEDAPIPPAVRRAIAYRDVAPPPSPGND